MGLGFWITAAVLSLSAFFAAFIDGRKRAERVGELEAELTTTRETLRRVRIQLHKARNPSRNLGELIRMFDGDA